MAIRATSLFELTTSLEEEEILVRPMISGILGRYNPHGTHHNTTWLKRKACHHKHMIVGTFSLHYGLYVVSGMLFSDFLSLQPKSASDREILLFVVGKNSSSLGQCRQRWGANNINLRGWWWWDWILGTLLLEYNISYIPSSYHWSISNLHGLNALMSASLPLDNHAKSSFSTLMVLYLRRNRFQWLYHRTKHGPHCLSQ